MYRQVVTVCPPVRVHVGLIFRTMPVIGRQCSMRWGNNLHTSPICNPTTSFTITMGYARHSFAYLFRLGDPPPKASQTQRVLHHQHYCEARQGEYDCGGCQLPCVFFYQCVCHFLKPPQQKSNQCESARAEYRRHAQKYQYRIL